MKNKIKRIVVSLFVFISLFSCNNKDEEQVKVISLLSGGENIVEKIKVLDETHENLLNPSVSEDKINEVLKSWKEVHSKMNQFLNEKGFSWGLDDKAVKLYNRFYFDKKGNIKVYAFRFFNKVSETKEKEFIKLMEEFVKQTSISLEREKAFAQCGKIALPNNS